MHRAGLCAEPDLPDILRLVLGNVRLRSGRWPVFLEGSKGGLLFCQRNGKSRLMLPGEHLTRVIIFLLVLLLARPSCGPARCVAPMVLLVLGVLDVLALTSGLVCEGDKPRSSRSGKR